MNSIFTAAFIIYLLVFIIIGLLDAKKIRNFRDYSTAGKNQRTFAVVMTLLATMIGVSTTIGITDTVFSIGFPGIWWLAFGALGLVLQSVLISEKVRDLDADTLPDLAGRTVGRPAELLIALVIVVSWIGVIAGQLAALGRLISFALGKSEKWLFVLVAVIVIIYTMTGGQLSVVRTDKIQLAVILAGTTICVIWLYAVKGGNTADVFSNIELLNESYTPANLATQFFVIGGVFFLGPDILSRNFISGDAKTARRSAWISGLILLAFAAMITMTGMWIRYNVTPEQLGDSGALMYAVTLLPKAAAVIMVFGLLSAILSSTDTCIINASVIFVKDILKKESVKGIRVTVAVIGALSLSLVLLGRGDIMSLLSGAYSIYTPGVIFPLTIAIFACGKHDINRKLWLAAVAAGGIIGLAGNFFGNALSAAGIPDGVLKYLTLIGMGISLVLSLLSVRRR